MPQKSAALAATAVASFLVPFMMSAVGICLPAIQADLSATAVELSWVEGGYMLSLAVILLPVGRIADILGRRRIFLWGTTWFTVVTLLTSLAWSMTALLVLRVLQGIGAAMINSTGVAMITSMYPREERGKAMGVIVGCVYAGLSVGPLLGGMLTHLAGWRAVFFMGLPLGGAAWILARRIGQEWCPARGEAFDAWGAFLYGGFVVALMKGLTGLSDLPMGVPLLCLAAGLGWMFLRRAGRTAFPVLDVRLFANRIFTMSSLATMINYAGTFAVAFLLSLHLQVVKGFAPMQAGLILVIQPVVQALLSPLAGMLSDRWNAAFMATSGMALCGLGLLGLSMTTVSTPVWGTGTLLVIMGMGFALFASPNMNVIMGSVDKKDYSVASSLVGTMRTFGMSLSMGIATVIFGLWMHGMPVAAETVPEFSRSLRAIFGVCAGLSVVGVLCSLGRTRLRVAATGGSRSGG